MSRHGPRTPEPSEAAPKRRRASRAEPETVTPGAGADSDEFRSRDTTDEEGPNDRRLREDKPPHY